MHFRSLWERKLRCGSVKPSPAALVRAALKFSSPSPPNSIKIKAVQKDGLYFYGAGDEARTRYLHLGKVALYRMSYTRIGNMAYYTPFREKVKSQF